MYTLAETEHTRSSLHFQNLGLPRIPSERLLAATGHRARTPHSLRAWSPRWIAVQMSRGSCLLQVAPSTSVLLLRLHGITMPWDFCFPLLTHGGEGKAQSEATEGFSITEVLATASIGGWVFITGESFSLATSSTLRLTLKCWFTQKQVI